jgi:hypothetical protein
MRVRLLNSGGDALLIPGGSAAGRVLHPNANCAEWAIVALDCPVPLDGTVVEMLMVRPAVADARVGAVVPIPVHIAAVTGLSEVEGQTVYKIGPLLGKMICEGVADP